MTLLDFVFVIIHGVISPIILLWSSSELWSITLYYLYELLWHLKLVRSELRKEKPLTARELEIKMAREKNLWRRDGPASVNHIQLPGRGDRQLVDMNDMLSLANCEDSFKVKYDPIDKVVGFQRVAEPTITVVVAKNCV